MKIVRLESKPNLTETQFTNDLSIPVQIKSNGEVALKNITFNFNNLKFNIPKNKYRVNFNLIQGEDNLLGFDNYMPGGLYSLDELITKIRQILNFQLPSNQELDSDLGFGFEWDLEWLYRNSGGVYTTLKFYRNEQIDVITENIDIQQGYDATDNQIESILVDNEIYYYKNPLINNPDGLYNGGFKSINQSNNGAWKLNFKIYQRDVEPLQNSNWIMGISRENGLYVNTLDKIAENMYTGIGVTNGVYVIKKNGGISPIVFNGNNIIPEDMDEITIYKQYNGTNTCKVIYTIKRGTETYDAEGDIITINDTNILGISSDDIYLVCKIQNDDGKIAFFDINMNPTGTKELINGEYIEKTMTKIIYNTNYGDVQPSEVEIGLLSSTTDVYDFCKLLGFNENVLKMTALSGFWNSSNRIDYNIFYKDLVIEIDELNLDGFDQGVKMSRNIVMTITAAELKQAINQLSIDSLSVSYTEPAQFLFVGMNNGDIHKTLSNLTIRAYINGKLIPIDGDMSATLLFRDDRDKKVMI